jgi:N-acetylglucosaminyl-diphospho-decaprenol L-rhamnosyltransferase
LDETILAYMEILDLALRLRTAGWGTVGVAEALGVHLGSATYGRRSARQRRLAGFSRGYLIRRYGVLRGRAAARTLFTEAAVVALDLLSCHDTQALRGRVRGWQAAGPYAPYVQPPREAIDPSISLWGSLMLRRGAYRPSPQGQ